MICMPKLSDSRFSDLSHAIIPRFSSSKRCERVD
jgi:hypothetical protein